MPGRRRHRLVGIHEVRHTLANGKSAVYRYAWRGGPRLKSKPGSDEELAEFVTLTRDRPQDKPEGTLSSLVYIYRHSANFTRLSDATQRSYNAALDLIEGEYGDMPVQVISERGARSEFIEWRDSYADTPRKADMLLTVLARVFSVAYDREKIDRNPLERVEKLSDGSRRDIIWTEEQVQAFRKAASDKLWLAMQLARWTGQRQGDLIILTWSAYDGEHISLKQGKTGRRVRIKVHSELKALLDATKREAVTILTTERGKRSWTSDGLRASWGKACDRAGIEGVTFHDLRGTFVTLAYRQGASIKEIAEVTGHSERDAEAIIRRHYLAGDNAVLKLEPKNVPQRKER